MRRFPRSAPSDAPLLIVGLAPGLQGANRTGRPFTGDYAGDLLYPTLLEYGFARGDYRARGSTTGSSWSTAGSATPCTACRRRTSRLPAEINTCRQFLIALIEQHAAPHARSSRSAASRTIRRSRRWACARAQAPFAHGAVHEAGHRRLYDSYHCSRYNTNTGVLTPDMFRAVFARVRADLG